MNAQYCGFRELPPFPLGSQLEQVNFNGNAQLETLPQLPPSLTRLNAGGCGFLHLPDFPADSQLQEFNIGGSYLLHDLPPIPPSVMRMRLDESGLRQLPPFPEGSELQELVISGSVHLQTLPRLPASLLRLEAQHSGLTQLPPFPEGGRLQALDLSGSARLGTLTALPPSLRQLDACNCALRQIANFPENSQLEQLFVANNQLTQIPPLPRSLQTLWVDENRSLTRLPVFPPTLSQVAARACGFTALPELGTSLQRANFSSNQIHTLTQRTQPSVNMLNLANNPIALLPEWIHQLPPQATVFVSSENLAPRTRLTTMTRANDAWRAGTGPHINFGESDHNAGLGAVTAPNQPGQPVPQRTLGAVAGAWMDNANANEDRQRTWAAFANENGAQDFANFLDRLSLTTNHIDPNTRAAFRQGVQQLLDDMARSPDLRADCFAICVSATETCEDRVTLSYQQMAVPRLKEAVRRGDFDSPGALYGFIDQTRSLYRRDILTDIANRKVATQRQSDPVEVHLAFQVGLNEVLDLQLDAQQMRFHGASGVTEADLRSAEEEVQHREDQGFANHLINHSGPWELLMQRHAPDLHQQMVAAKHRAIEPQRLAPAIRAHLARLGLPDDADTRREVGRVVSEELTLRAQQPLVDQFMRRQEGDPEALLGPRWSAS